MVQLVMFVYFEGFFELPVSSSEPPQGAHYYCGPSAKNIGAAANPRLWFKGFRMGMSEELFGTVRAFGRERKMEI